MSEVSGEVKDMCCLEDLEVKVKQSKLRWFGQVRRAEKGGVSRDDGR